MKKLILNIFTCLIFLSVIGFRRDVRKEEVSKKIALLAAQEEKIKDFYSLDLEKDSLSEIDSKLNEALYSKYSVQQTPEFKTEGVAIYEIATDKIEMDSIHILFSHPVPFVVAVSDDLKTFRLFRFEGQNEFGKMIDYLFNNNMLEKKNILPLSVLFYCIEITSWDGIKVISNPMELAKEIKEWSTFEDYEKFAKSVLRLKKDEIMPPSVVRAGDGWDVTFFIFVSMHYCCPRFGKVQMHVSDKVFTIVSDERIF
ncbi:MAG: hypothetical protein MUP17_08905 [candidate division Zixibacteria bacterium]|nr:hypothetical protein [candidate division Zixibacteria bacterium]